MTTCPICQNPDNATIGSTDFHGSIFTFSCESCAKQIAQELKDLALQHGAEYSTKGTMITGPKGSPHVSSYEQLLKLVYPPILLIKTLSEDEYGEHECDWAVIKPTPELKAILLGYKSIFDSTKAQNGDLSRIELYDYSPDFISETDTLAEFIPDRSGIHQVNSHDWLSKEGVLPLWLYLHRNAQVIGTTTVVSSEAGFKWETTPRSCDFTVETTFIEWDALNHFFGEN